MEFFLQILLNSLVSGTQILFLSISLYLIKTVSKIEHVALGAIGTTIAYGVYSSFKASDSILISLLTGLIAATILGLISFKLLEPFYKKKQTLYALLVSLAFGLGLESLLGIIFGSGSKNFIDGVLETIKFGAIRITVPGFYTIILGIVLATLTYIIVKKTPLGRNLQSLSENQNLVASLGINQISIRKTTYILASIIAGTVGTLISLNSSLNPTLGFNFIIIAFISLFVGGSKDIKGIIIASYILSLVPEFLINYAPNTLNVTSSYKMLFIFIIALILLSFKPNGLFSKNVRSN